MDNYLPFKVGQQAESKCFIEGYRSAWFRCKIKGISTRRGQIGHSLEFFDFPDEKVTWTQLYQTPPRVTSESYEESKVELMVRPSFPSFYRKSQVPDSHPACDVIGIVEDDWKVGDLVDWWTDSSFWSGRVTQLLDNDKVQIALPDPPMGEGKSYEALCKDLRPSLEWSPEHGWTVPMSREYGDSQYCVRLVQPRLQEEEKEDNTTLVESATEINDVTMDWEPDSAGEGKHSCLYEGSNESKYTVLVKRSDTVESAIMELEEIASKIRWLRGLLQFGFRWSNAMKPSWKFL